MRPSPVFNPGIRMSDYTETTPARLEAIYKERHKVRFDPTINMGHLISAGVSLISAAAFVVTGWALIDKRVVLLEEAKSYQAARDVAQDAAMRDKFDDVKGSLAELKASVNELRRDLRDKK